MLNKMLIIGNVGRDPEMRYAPSGDPVASFSVAVNRRYTPPNGEPQEETEWFEVSAWNRTAEACNNFVTKGMKVYVEGRLQSRSWIGQDGQTRFQNQIVASNVIFLTPRNGATPDASQGNYAPQGQQDYSYQGQQGYHPQGGYKDTSASDDELPW